jgi:protein-S-isoprenylcysteine O-methyltransferase Ste14
MSFYTEMNIGLWNAWIGGVIPLLAHVVIMLTNKGAWKRLGDMSWYTTKDKWAAYSSMFLMYSMIVFSLWLPLKVGTAWFYTGVTIYAVSMVCYLLSYRNFSATPESEVSIKGIYRFSRNPLYFFYSLLMAALCIASASLPLFGLWILYNISVHHVVLGEERYCLNTYGESYREYMVSTPRYFIFF